MPEDELSRLTDRVDGLSVVDPEEVPDVGGTESIKRRWREWLLLDGERVTVAAGIAVLLFALFFALEWTGYVPLRSSDPLFYVLGGMISGNLTVITVVVSINQLLLSRELSTPGELTSQIDGVIDYREGVEDAAGEIAPVKPLGFLRLLFENTRREAQRLGGLNVTMVDDEVAGRVDDVVADLTDHVDDVDRLLKRSDVATFNVLSVTLTTNYAKQINELRRIRHGYGEQLPDEVMTTTDELIDRLQEIDVARQYFKSVYLQEELSELSRMLFYVGVPAEAVAVLTLLLFTAPDAASVPGEWLTVLVPAALAVGLFPIVVLSSYILRISTVTERTAATIPFTTPEQEK